MGGEHHSRGDHRRDELASLVALSVPAESISLPIGPNTRRLALAGVLAPALLLVHLWIGPLLLKVSWATRWDWSTLLLRLSVFDGHQTAPALAAGVLLAVGVALAYVTDGFTVAGPRLQRILLRSSQTASPTLAIPAMTVLLVIATALAAALLLLAAALVAGLLGGLDALLDWTVGLLDEALRM